MLADDDLKSLADDIKTNGLQQPIVIDDADAELGERTNDQAAAEPFVHVAHLLNSKGRRFRLAVGLTEIR
jgi:hypothetical protein